MLTDLQHLTEENIETLSESMTHVEKMRLIAGLEALGKQDESVTLEQTPD